MITLSNLQTTLVFIGIGSIVGVGTALFENKNRSFSKSLKKLIGYSIVYVGCATVLYFIGSLFLH